jgi:hypothetical protein
MVAKYAAKSMQILAFQRASDMLPPWGRCGSREGPPSMHWFMASTHKELGIPLNLSEPAK